jgi:hypothetical protein
MKKLLRIFVEGSTDLRFLTDLVWIHFGKTLNKSEIIVTRGWSNLFNEENLNIIQLVAAQGGSSLVIFDTDKDSDIVEESFVIRRELLINKAKKNKVLIDLFLFPNNKEDGDIESLLQTIANPNVYEPVATCYESYFDCLQEYNQRYQSETGIRLNIFREKDRRKLALRNFLSIHGQKSDEHKRNYTDTNFWNFNSPALHPLIDSLRPHFS